ncbi:hypothetical protein BC628DRAFT_1123381 [Trametes gibbosa]|nr:hypothetical protein BC628DRAFT_1123381 [Trametes gibbosa]
MVTLEPVGTLRGHPRTGLLDGTPWCSPWEVRRVRSPVAAFSRAWWARCRPSACCSIAGAVGRLHTRACRGGSLEISRLMGLCARLAMRRAAQRKDPGRGREPCVCRSARPRWRKKGERGVRAVRPSARTAGSGASPRYLSARGRRSA